MKKVWLRAVLAVGLFLSALVWTAVFGAAQTPAASAGDSSELLTGAWAFYVIEADSEPPPPPPVYASYRKNEAPLEKIARAVFEKKDGKLHGKAVFAKGLIWGKDGGDVAGQPEVPLEDLSFDGKVLRFKATVEGKGFEGEASLQGARGDRFEGTWKSGDRAGKLFLNKRN